MVNCAYGGVSDYPFGPSEGHTVHETRERCYLYLGLREKLVAGTLY